jgi:phosphate-selective porin OprO and OprP
MKSPNALVAIAVLAGIVASAQAAPDPVDILIQRLVERNVISEKDGKDIRAEIADIQKADAKKAKETPAALPVTAKTPVKLSGYAQARYTSPTGSATGDTFDVRRLRISLAGTPVAKVDYAVQVDLSGSTTAVTGVSGAAVKTGSVGKPTLLDAAVGFTASPLAKITAGQFKIPFSQESLASDALLDAINRAQVVDKLTPGRDNGSVGRDVGLQLSGQTLPKPGSGRFEYVLGAFNGSGINVVDDNRSKDVAARIVWKPDVQGLSFGASQYWGRKGSPYVKRDRTGLEASFVRPQYGVKGEYIEGKDAAVKKRGYYVTGVLGVAPATQAVLRYEQLDLDKSVSGNTGTTTTLGVNYFLSKDTLNRVQLNYEHHRNQGPTVKNDQFLAQYQGAF